MKQTTNTKKLALAGVLTALAIVGSFLSFPVAGSKCAPVQHMVNIFAAVLLGPGALELHSVQAFCAIYLESEV